MILSIDPSSTVLGIAVMDNDSLIRYGIIDATKQPYEKRYMFIIKKLNEIIKKYPIDEIACEMAMKFKGRRVAALEVAVTSIKHWAKKQKLDISFYSPGEWKASVTGKGNSDKEQVADVIRLHYPILKPDTPDHITDAIAIGLCHIGVIKLKEMTQ